MEERLVTIAAFAHPFQADFCKTILDLEGIDSCVIDANIGQLIPLYSLATGGVKLQVRESDVQRAVAALRRKAPAKFSDEFELNVIDDDEETAREES